MRRRGHAAPDPLPPGAPAPDVNDLVTLVAPSGRVRRTRVEDVTPGWLALVPPAEDPGTVEELPSPGDPFEVHWASGRGLLVLPCVLLERAPGTATGGVPQWRLQPTGPAELHQRRSYARAPVVSDWPVRAALTWLLPQEGTAGGELLDLGEGGLRARLVGWDGGEGTSVVVRLTVAEGEERAAPVGVSVTEFELMGTAVRAREQPAGAAPGTTEVVVQLHDPGARADDLRALVFAWQRRARRS